MKSVYKRWICFLLALVMLPMCIFEVAVPTQAAYENTYTNTGDMRADIIGVAKTQVGYREYNNRTKYGEWYGYAQIAWCAVFIGWCADQAGIPQSIIKRQGWANPSSFGWKSYPASVRMPQPGDVFFRNTAHTGLVYYVEGNYFYTIEGNTWGDGDSTPRVMIRKRDLYSSSYTFASPAYEGESGSIPAGCDHSFEKGSESAHPHKEYKKCTKCGYSYYTGLTVSLTNCQECKMANCSHNYGSWSKLDGTYHQATCSKCGKVNKSGHKWGSDEILKEATCKDEGKKKQKCNDCGATREVTIPATNQHEYTDIRYIDEKVHAQKCKSCDSKTEKPHKTGDWVGDTKLHWKSCEECGGRVSVGEHKLTGECGSVCEVCGITPNAGHMYISMWKQDDESHWLQCLYCSHQETREAHKFTADCDDTCDTCGYMREAEHIYSKEFKSDYSGHWLSCQICDQPKEKNPHAPGSEATEEYAQLCNVCGFEVTPVLIHSHSFSYVGAEHTHSGSCQCGTEAETETHLWDLQTGKCRICQIDIPAAPQQMLLDLLKMPDINEYDRFYVHAVLIGLAALIVLIILAILFSSLIRKLKIRAAEKLEEELAEEALEDGEQEPDVEEVLMEPPQPDPLPDPPSPPPVAEQIQSGEQIDTEDILRMVAEIEGLSYEESIAAVDAPELQEPVDESAAPAEEEPEEIPQEMPELEAAEETDEAVPV